MVQTKYPIKLWTKQTGTETSVSIICYMDLYGSVMQHLESLHTIINDTYHLLEHTTTSEQISDIISRFTKTLGIPTWMAGYEKQTIYFQMQPVNTNEYIPIPIQNNWAKEDITGVDLLPPIALHILF